MVFEYNIKYNVGKAKYLLSYYTGKKHDDGSKFFDIEIFKNKKKMDQKIKELKKEFEDWKKIEKQPKSKKWVLVEFINTSKNPCQTILAYKEDKEYSKVNGKYRVWIGNTDGTNRGKYFSCETKKEALKKVEELKNEN